MSHIKSLNESSKARTNIIEYNRIHTMKCINYTNNNTKREREGESSGKWEWWGELKNPLTQTHAHANVMTLELITSKQANKQIPSSPFVIRPCYAMLSLCKVELKFVQNVMCALAGNTSDCIRLDFFFFAWLRESYEMSQKILYTHAHTHSLTYDKFVSKEICLPLRDFL